MMSGYWSVLVRDEPGGEQDQEEEQGDAGKTQPGPRGRTGTHGAWWCLPRGGHPSGECETTLSGTRHGGRTLFRRPGLRTLIAFTLLFPVGFVLLVYPFFALIHERYFLFLAPWVVLLAVLGASSLPRFLRALSLAGLALLTAAGVFAYHGTIPWLVPSPESATLAGEAFPARFIPEPESLVTELSDGQPYGREPWRKVHEFIRTCANKNDLVAIHAWYMDYVWNYYALHDPEERAPLDTLLLPQHEWTSTETLEAFKKELSNRDQVFLILSHEETPDPDHWLDALGAAVARQWIEEGATGFSRLKPGPIEFPHGVRVEIFRKR